MIRKFENNFRIAISFVIASILLIVLVFAQDISTAGGDFVSVYNLEGVGHFASKDSEGNIIGNNYIFGEGGSMSVDYINKEGEVVKTITYSGLEDVDGKNPELFFDNNGKLIRGKFKTSKNGEFILGNEKVNLPEGATVNFDKGKAKVVLSDGLVSKPESFDGNPGETEFTFDYQDEGKYDYKFEGNDKVFRGNELKFYGGNFFIDYKGQSQLGSLKIVTSEDGVRTYLDFKGEINNEYDGAYISVDSEKGVFVTGSNVNKRGPKVAFAKDNPYGLRIGDKGNFAVQSLGNVNGAYYKIQRESAKDFRGADKFIPKYEWQNQFVINQDGGSMFYNSDTENLYITPTENLIKEFSAPIDSDVVIMGGRGLKDKGNGPEKFAKNDYIGFPGHKGIAVGVNPDYIISNTLWDRNGPDPAFSRGFSNLWAYYNLKTKEDFTRLTGIKIRDLGNLATPERLRLITDVVAQVPIESQKEIDIIELGGDLRPITDSLRLGSGTAAMAHSSGLIQLSSNSITANTLSHEIGHLRDFDLNAYGSSGFASQWASIGGNEAPYLTRQGANSRDEKISTFMEQIYQDQNYWNSYLKGRHSTRVKARIALLRKSGHITSNTAQRLLGGAGFASDDESLNKYIKDAQG